MSQPVQAARHQKLARPEGVDTNQQQAKPSSDSVAGKSAFNWDVYKDRRTALQHLKQNHTLVDTIIETEDGRAHELVHSQVMSAFGDKLTQFISDNGVSLPSLSNEHPSTQQQSLRRSRALQLSHQQSSQSAPPRSLAQDSGANTSTTTTKATTGQHVELSLLAHHKNAGTLKLVRLPKVNRYTLGILVECAYSGYIRTDLASGGIWQVLEMADYYEMADVIRACCAFLTKNLSQSNCIFFYHIGIKHRHPLQRAAWHQIRANFKHILAQNLADSSRALTQNGALGPRWAPNDSTHSNSSGPATAPSGQHSGRQVNLLTGIEAQIRVNNLATIKYEHFEPLLQHDKLNVDNEESVWQAIKLWCNFEPRERARQVASLLTCVRFPRLRLGTEFSARHIWRDPLIVDNESAQHQLAVLDRNHRDFLSSPLRLKPFRDGFGLPCSANPRQLRPRIPHSVFLAIGGWQQGQPTTLIESYDSNCNLWFESRRRIRSPLAYHGIECIGGLLYICGGTDGNDILNDLFTFDPVRGDCAPKPPMRDSRCYVSTAHLANHLYALGGHNGAQRMRSVERFELTRQEWAHVQDMNVARSDASACVHEGLIYIAGGLNDQVIESSVEFYNAADNTWTFISSMLLPRTSFTLLAFGHHLLAIGGNNGTDRLDDVEQYDFATKMWTQHSRMRHKRSTFSAALVDEAKLIVVGGYNGQTPFSQVEMFDAPTRQWIGLQKIRYDRSGLKAVVIKDLPNAAEYTFLGSALAAGQYNPHVSPGERRNPSSL